jgi:hypothetical protein
MLTSNARMGLYIGYLGTIVELYMRDSEQFLMRSLLYVLIVVSVVSLSQIVYSISTVNAVDQLDRYWVVLSGDQQIPPVNKGAIGFAALKFQDDSTRLVYNVNLDNIHNVTGVYLYHKNKDQNGTVVLDLLKEARESNREYARVSNITREGETTGTISLGGVTNEDLSGSLEGKSLSDLRELMHDGELYISVSTKDFPNGEISGYSFIGIDRIFPDLDEFDWD